MSSYSVETVKELEISYRKDISWPINYKSISHQTLQVAHHVKLWDVIIS